MTAVTAETLEPRLPFTIAFLLHGDRVLLLRRKFPPFVGIFNGVGGKLEPGETPLACILREVAEETGVTLKGARFGGVVTWTGHAGGTSGMYAYVANLPAGIDPNAAAGETEEGFLSWESTASVLAGRADVVDNIPSFLGPMLAGAAPAAYRLSYAGDRFLGCRVEPL